MAITNLQFAGKISADYVEIEASIPIADVKVKAGDTIKIYSWSNKDGYDVQGKAITLVL